MDNNETPKKRLGFHFPYNFLTKKKRIAFYSTTTNPQHLLCLHLIWLLTIEYTGTRVISSPLLSSNLTGFFSPSIMRVAITKSSPKMNRADNKPFSRRNEPTGCTIPRVEYIAKSTAKVQSQRHFSYLEVNSFMVFSNSIIPISFLHEAPRDLAWWGQAFGTVISKPTPDLFKMKSFIFNLNRPPGVGKLYPIWCCYCSFSLSSAYIFMLRLSNISILQSIKSL